MAISLFDYVLEQLDASKGKWASVAEGSGVPYKTLQKIAQRHSKDPAISTVQKLADYFRAQPPPKVLSPPPA